MVPGLVTKGCIASAWARAPGLPRQVGHLQPMWIDAEHLREVAKSSEKVTPIADLRKA